MKFRTQSLEKRKISIDKFENNLKTDDIIALKGLKGKGLLMNGLQPIIEGDTVKLRTELC